ncbi:MAG: hypothetical protein MUC83_10380 [Pirellula sp.]|jgi:hypothetical protein|nr:hypothetical protein [Pirellula sp.]
MKRINKFVRPSVFLLLALSGTFSLAQDKPARTMFRLFWQDTKANQLMWGDVKRADDKWSIEPQSIPGFPKLDPERQSLVQMQTLDGVIVVGIRDDESGKFQSGWVSIDSGVTVEDHGDHSHWYYKESPKVLVTRLDDQQGNPAHVYLYDEQVILANDSKNGFTVLTKEQLKANDPRTNGTFYSGGGNHITLAAHSQKVVYSTWVDREGENTGRIDVVNIDSKRSSPGYSFKLPAGGLHGATSASKRVFFAPSDGVYSLFADANLSSPPNETAIEHISLGVDAKTGKPNRTGAFENLDSWVLFAYGSGDDSKNGMLDASKPKLNLVSLGLPAGEGLSLVTPVAFQANDGRKLAIVPHDRKQSENQEKVSVIDLDPNKDSDLSDAKLVSTINVGPSLIEGHSGHHDVSVSPNKRLACISNSGDGSIWIVGLNDFTVQAKLSVGGSPARVVAQ